MAIKEIRVRPHSRVQHFRPSRDIGINLQEYSTCKTCLLPSVPRRDPEVLFVARDEHGNSMGTLYVDYDLDQQTAHVQEIDTVSEYRGKGVARDLIRRFEDEARAFRVKVVYLEAFADVVPFWERMEYKVMQEDEYPFEVEDWDTAEREGLVPMFKELN